MRLGLGLGIDRNRVLGGAPSYTPADDTELFDWWDAQTNVTTGSGEVTAWAGVVNSESANPPTVTSRPEYGGGNQINGLDVLNLRGSDPNYLSIDFSSLGSGCCIYMVIEFDNSRGNVICDSSSNLKSVRYQSGSGSQSVTFENLGSSVVFYFSSGTSIGTNISRATLYTNTTSSTGVLVMDNIDLSPITGNCYIGARSDLGENCNGLIADIIISEGNTFLSENLNFLKTKYGIA